MAKLSALQIYDVARAAGFPPTTAVKMVAIALRESGGNTLAHNGTPPDDSYGLWQLNMLGKLLPERLRLFGISSPQELYDPAVNARAARVLWGGNDANLARHWYIDRNTAAIPYKDRYEAGLPAALAAAAQRGETGVVGGGPVLASNSPPAPGPGVSFPPASLLPQAVTLIPLAASGKTSGPCLAWLLPSSPGSSYSMPSLEQAIAALSDYYGTAAVIAARKRAGDAS